MIILEYNGEDAVILLGNTLFFSISAVSSLNKITLREKVREGTLPHSNCDSLEIVENSFPCGFPAVF